MSSRCHTDGTGNIEYHVNRTAGGAALTEPLGMIHHQAGLPLSV